MSVTHFTIRTYFFLFNEERTHVLVSDEKIMGKYVTKFPGGGLEFGEGTRECVVREAMEELHQPITCGELIYVTDFFVASAFRPSHQVLCIYYTAEMQGEACFTTTTKIFDFSDAPGDQESFRWVPFSELTNTAFTFESDRRAALELVKKCD